MPEHKSQPDCSHVATDVAGPNRSTPVQRRAVHAEVIRDLLRATRQNPVPEATEFLDRLIEQLVTIEQTELEAIQIATRNVKALACCLGCGCTLAECNRWKAEARELGKPVHGCCPDCAHSPGDAFLRLEQAAGQNPAGTNEEHPAPSPQPGRQR